METVMTKAVMFLCLSAIRLYRVFLAPVVVLVFGVQCRFEESCSHYTERVIRESGVFRGTCLGVRRIISCNQWIEIGSKHG